MAVSIEKYIIVNFFVDLILLSVIARCKGCVSWKRLPAAALLGTGYAVLAQLEGGSFLKTAPFGMAFALVMAAVAFKPAGIRGIFRGAVWMLAAAVLLGGAQMLIRESGRLGAAGGLLAGCVLGAGMLLGFSRMRINRVEKWEVEVIVRKGGKQARFTALIDTGNRLHEPISGLPVLIVEKAKIEQLLPPGFCADAPQPGFRRVPFGGVGGNGYMNVFRPETLLVNYSDGWMRAPAVWIGVFPGYIPGDVCALAPAVLGAVGKGTEGKSEDI